MFETIDDDIERTEGGRPTVKTRLVRLTGIAMVLAVLVGGLYFAIK